MPERGVLVVANPTEYIGPMNKGQTGARGNNNNNEEENTNNDSQEYIKNKQGYMRISPGAVYLKMECCMWGHCTKNQCKKKIMEHEKENKMLDFHDLLFPLMTAPMPVRVAYVGILSSSLESELS